MFAEIYIIILKVALKFYYSYLFKINKNFKTTLST